MDIKFDEFEKKRIHQILGFKFSVLGFCFYTVLTDT